MSLISINQNTEKEFKPGWSVNRCLIFVGDRNFSVWYKTKEEAQEAALVLAELLLAKTEKVLDELRNDLKELKNS